jgi:hypothetical protein
MGIDPLVLLGREGCGVVPRPRSLDGHLPAWSVARQHWHFNAAPRGSVETVAASKKVRLGRCEVCKAIYWQVE